MTFDLPDQFIELPPGPVEDPFLKDSVEAIQRNFQALRNQVGGLDAAGGALRVVGAGGQRVSFGATSIGSFAAGAGIDATIAHGLGVTPSTVLLTATECAIAGDLHAATNIAVGGVDASDITVRARTPGYLASSTTITVYWVVIGS